MTTVNDSFIVYMSDLNFKLTLSGDDSAPTGLDVGSLLQRIHSLEVENVKLRRKLSKYEDVATPIVNDSARTPVPLSDRPSTPGRALSEGSEPPSDAKLCENWYVGDHI